MRMKTWLAAAAIGGALLLISASEVDAHGRRRGCDAHVCCVPPPPPVHIVLQVCHPCTGCRIDVPVCVPACCQGAPRVCFRNTLIGQGKTVFEWDCGHRVIVRYSRHGHRVLQRG